MQKGNLSLLLFLAAAVVAIVVVVIAMGGVSNVPSPSPTPSDVKTQELMQQSTSDETSSIESDLRTTEFTGLDAELTDIDKEVNQ
ncbi:hypothetical protein HYZ78_03045 [Candidatus Microgenomates bacterium]|nr:hypothetical protein [Candidatus Microgenomates bacterium]